MSYYIIKHKHAKMYVSNMTYDTTQWSSNRQDAIKYRTALETDCYRALVNDVNYHDLKTVRVRLKK